MAKIRMTKHKAETPDWFNNDNYKFTQDLNVKGWLKQFFIRESFSMKLKHNPNLERQTLWEGYLNEITQIAREPEFSTREGSVKSVVEIEPGMTGANISHIEKKVLSVDLVAPDDTIKREFEIWLRAKRKMINAEEKESRSNHPDITPKKMGKWRNGKLLQLYDVNFWKDCLQQDISGPTIAKWVYPNIDDPPGKELYRNRCDMIDTALKDLRPMAYQALRSN